MKTAANIVGSAFFAAGYEVQDAPRYGAERRGAPMVAYVRAARTPIVERGAIATPDLVIVADTTLLGLAGAAVMQGANARTVMFVNSDDAAAELRARWRYPGTMITWPPAGPSPRLASAPSVSTACAGAAARLVGAIPRDALERALIAEAAGRSGTGGAPDSALGLGAYDALGEYAGIVVEAGAQDMEEAAAPDWIRLELDDAERAAPDIFAPATSALSDTGSWRTSRPVIDYAHCNRCSWVCSTLCPDSAIRVDADRTPHIDYDHCKGCLVCVVACPPHAIRTMPEREARACGAPW